jgi:hypothetical protein
VVRFFVPLINVVKFVNSRIEVVTDVVEVGRAWRSMGSKAVPLDKDVIDEARKAECAATDAFHFVTSLIFGHKAVTLWTSFTVDIFHNLSLPLFVRSRHRRAVRPLSFIATVTANEMFTDMISVP